LQRTSSGWFERQLDLADPAVLVQLANDSGLPGEQLIQTGAAYEQNRQDAIAADVFG
jgi:2-hydroxychromene-2-carboxylate isomerase